MDFKKKCEFLALTGIFQKENKNNDSKLDDLNTPPVSSNSDYEDNLEANFNRRKIKLKKIFFDKIPITFSKKKEFCYKYYKNKVKRNDAFNNLNKFQKAQLIYNDSISILNKTRFVSYDYERFCATGYVEQTIQINQQTSSMKNNNDVQIENLKNDDQHMENETKQDDSNNLSRRSRVLKRLIKQCSVKIIRLNKNDLINTNLSPESLCFMQRLNIDSKSTIKETTCKKRGSSSKPKIINDIPNVVSIVEKPEVYSMAISEEITSTPKIQSGILKSIFNKNNLPLKPINSPSPKILSVMSLAANPSDNSPTYFPLFHKMHSQNKLEKDKNNSINQPGSKYSIFIKKLITRNSNKSTIETIDLTD